MTRAAISTPTAPTAPRNTGATRRTRTFTRMLCEGEIAPKKMPRPCWPGRGEDVVGGKDYPNKSKLTRIMLNNS
jgi:hypothetical protein